jgi:hypothetical protein
MKKVYGVGINDSETPVQLKDSEGNVKWRCPFYTKWANMLKRCYSKASLSERPNYGKSTVCEEWKSFSTFKDWMSCQDHEGKCLDKDLLGDGTIYSPNVCVFIDSDVNSFIKSSKNKWGLPQGVALNSSGGIHAHFGSNGVNNYLGRFETIEDAVRAHNNAKRNSAIELFSDRPTWVLDAIVRRFSEN